MGRKLQTECTYFSSLRLCEKLNFRETSTHFLETGWKIGSKTAISEKAFNANLLARRTKGSIRWLASEGENTGRWINEVSQTAHIKGKNCILTIEYSVAWIRQLHAMKTIILASICDNVRVFHFGLSGDWSGFSRIWHNHSRTETATEVVASVQYRMEVWTWQWKNEYGLKTHVPSVPNVPWYRSTLGTRVLTPRSTFIKNCPGAHWFWAFQINGSEIRKEFYSFIALFYGTEMVKTVKSMHGFVGNCTVLGTFPRNRKIGRCHLWTGDRSRKMERISENRKSTWNNEADTLLSEPASRNNKN